MAVVRCQLEGAAKAKSVGWAPPGPYTGRDPEVKKPAWLRQRAAQGEKYARLRESLGELKLNTVCVEAQCPNIGEVGANQIISMCSIQIRCILGCGVGSVLQLWDFGFISF
jgi:lipoate synthase